VTNSGGPLTPNTILSPLLASNTTSVKPPATNADPKNDDGPENLVGDDSEIKAKGVDDGVNEGMPAFPYLINILLIFITQSFCLADSTTSTKETAPSQVAVGAAGSIATSKEIAPCQVAVGAAHSTTTGDGAAAAENRADETQANTVNMPVFAGVPAVPVHNDEATKKRPAAGDIFRFQPNNCAEW
jgi:hypothetical protein